MRGGGLCIDESFNCNDEFSRRAYERLVGDWRHYDNLLWQIPFGTATVVGVVLTLIYYYLTGLGPGTIMLKLGLLFILLIFAITMMALSIKIRYFQIERAECIEEIERRCTRVNAPYETEAAYPIISRTRARFEGVVGRGGIRAYQLQVILFMAMMAAILIAMATTAQQLDTQHQAGIASLIPNWAQAALPWITTIFFIFFTIFIILLFVVLIGILIRLIMALLGR
ncbi:hypothetical protein [Vulcanisaeta distributa]|uniref:hypothetical protein n=1 Tax=Vulcanisaeta distributa TaxID=164451 RepID=UPI0006CF79C9|nr:hypothetical protein [Vulcanisaeta distributa]